MIQVFKMVSDTDGYDKKIPSLFTKSTTDLRGHSHKLFSERFAKDIGKYTFKNRVVKIWNSLPNSVVTAKDVKSFERGLDKHWLNQEVLYENYKADIKI